MHLFNFFSAVWSRILSGILILSFLLVPFQTVSAQTFSAPRTLNYQAKLTTPAGAAVSNGTYNLWFRLYTAPASPTTSAIWSEQYMNADRVQVTNGLLSVDLGSLASFAGVDFNQPLYLGVEVGGTSVTPVWDGEMSPRKTLSSTPSAFVADTLDGLDSSDFLRATATSDDINEGSSNLYFTSSRATSSFAQLLAATTTSALAEGTNLYFTNARFDGRFAMQLAATTTDAIGEGATNLYFTTPRVQTYLDTIAKGYFFATTSADAWDATKDRFSTTSSDAWLATKTTTDLAEGTNLYWTTLRGAALLAGTTTDALAEGATNKYYSTLRFAADLAGTTTDALTEGSTNWYFTPARFAQQLAGTTTTALAEGTNLYFTTPRVQTYLDTIAKGYFFSTSSVTYWDSTISRWATTSSDAWLATKSTDNLTEGLTNHYYSTLRFATDLAGTTTTALTEGTNLYFTNARAQAALAGYFATTTAANTWTVTQTFSDLIATNSTTTNATTTNLFANQLTLGTATTTAGNGVNLTSGCFALNGTCLTQGLTTAVTSLNGLTQSVQSFATTSDANITLTIDSAGSTHTFTPAWQGTLAATRGGTGMNTITANQLLIGGAGNTWSQIATSSLGLLTTDVAEGTNLYFTTPRVQTYLDTIAKGYFFATTSADAWDATKDRFSTTSSDAWLATKTTTDLAEGTNLYWTTLRGAALLAGTTTDALAEGATNKYYSTLRFAADLAGTTTDALTEGTANWYFTPARFAQQLAGTTTTALAEGTNLYFTNPRVQTYLDTIAKGYFFSTSSVTYWDSTISRWATSSSDAWLATKTTDNVTEGATNRYYSTLRFASDLAGTTTTALAEGTNLYFTNARAQAALAGYFATVTAPNTWTVTQTFSDLIATNSTTTNATTTNLFASKFSAASFFATLGNFLGLTATNSTTTNATTTNLSTTNLAVTGAGTSTFGGGLASAGLSSTNGLIVTSGGVRVASLTSCDTIDTDGAGNFICGTDAGAGGSSEINWTYFNNSGVRISTSTNQVLIGATATTSLAKLEVAGDIRATYFTATSTTASSTFGANVIGPSGVNVGSGSVYAVNGVGILTRAANGAIIGGDLSGDARGFESLDIQSGRSSVTRVASGLNSIAIGHSSLASNFGSIAIGYQNSSLGIDSSALGSWNSIGNSGVTGSVAVGYTNNVLGNYSAALGVNNTTGSSPFWAGYGSAVGVENTVLGTSSSAFGFKNTASSSYSSLFGFENLVTATGSSAFGSFLVNTVASSTDLGPDNNSKVTVFNSGIFQASALNIASTTASSTFANGINLTSGCFALNGTCLTQGLTTAVTSLNGLTQSVQTFATTSDANITLTIDSAGSTHTFTPAWTGTLAATRGGTGMNTITANQLLLGGAGNTWNQIATSSLGLLTTDVAEGTNLYFTTPRVQTYLDTIAKGYFFSTSSVTYWDSTIARWATTSSDAWLATKTTDNVTEGATNRYYSTLRFAADLAGTTTTALTEGTNLYFTNARAQAALAGYFATTTQANTWTVTQTFSDLIATNSTTTNATTTNLFASQLTATNGTTTNLSTQNLTISTLTTPGILTNDASGFISSTTSLPLAWGGTGTSTLGASGAIAYSNGLSYAFSSVGLAGQALVSGGSGAPTFFAPTQGSIVFAGTNGALAENNAAFFWDNATSRLGIGTNAPSAMLDIVGAGNALRLAYDGSTYNTLSTGADGNLNIASSNATEAAIVLGDNTAQHIFVAMNGDSSDFYAGIDNNTKRYSIGTGLTPGAGVLMTIDADGSATFGTSSPFARLGVQGVYGGQQALFDVASSTNASGSATTSLFRILANGTVGIGTTSPSATFGVEGSGFFSGLLSALGANFTNATITSATTTNLSTTNFSASSFFATLGNFFGLTATNSTTTNATTTNLSTTNLAVTGVSTSTFANGIQLSNGCFRDASGTCIKSAGDTAVVVAASNSSAAEKAYADYVADGTNDEVEINQAINYVYAGGRGGKVYLLEGTFTLDTSYNTAGDDASVLIATSTSLIGSGPSTVLRLKNAHNQGIFLVAFNGSTSTLSNLTLDGNKSNQAGGVQHGVGISMSGGYSTDVSDLAIDRVTIKNFRNNGIDATWSVPSRVSVTNSTISNNDESGVTQYFYNSIFSNNIVSNNGSDGFYLSAWHSVIEGNSVFGNGGSGIYVTETEDFLISSNQVLQNQENGIIVSDAGYGSITGNVSRDNILSGAVMRISSGEIIFSDNVIEGSGQHGLDLRNSWNVNIAGNTINSNAWNGIYSWSSATSLSITGNYIAYNGGTGATSSILLAGTTNLVSGNLIEDWQGTGYAIEISPTASDTLLSGNKFVGPSAQRVSDLGVSTRYTQSDRLTLDTLNLGSVAYSPLSIFASSSVALASSTQMGIGKIMSLNNSGGEVFTVANNGNVGIGTSSPYAKLSVVGNVVADSFNATTSTGYQINGVTIATASTTKNNFYFAGATTVDINTGTFNIAMGPNAMQYATSGTSNFAVGSEALRGDSSSNGSTGSNNIAIGYSSLRYNTTGYSNTALGLFALLGNRSGHSNTALGTQALANNDSGKYNTALGSLALFGNYFGSNNTAIGPSSLYTNISGSSLNAIGWNSLYNTTGASSTALGSWAGMTNTSGNNNLYLGDEADALAGTYSNSAAIGSHAKVGASNSIVLGGTGAWATNVGIGTSTPWAKLSIMNTNGDQTALFDVASSTNASGSATTSLFRIGANGNIGIGTTSPYAKLSVVGNVVADTFFATSTTATSTFAGGLDVGAGGLVYDYSTGVTSISSLELGNIVFPADGGIMSWTDMDVTGASPLGTINSYTSAIDGNPLLTLFSTSDGAGGVSSSGVGIGTTSPFARLAITGLSGQVNPLFQIASSTDSPYLTLTSDGNLGLGTTSPTARLALERLNVTTPGTAGLDQYLTFTNGTQNAVQYANALYAKTQNTATTTLLGNIIRIEDNSPFGNTVRGLEIQADMGTSTLGENTAFSAYARTFGIRAITSGDAGAIAEPAAGYFETQGTTQGNAIRAYSSSILSGVLAKFFQTDSDFEGTGIMMDFGNGGGSFSSTTASKFLDLRNGGTSVFAVGPYGGLTVGDGVTSAGVQISNGTLRVNALANCDVKTDANGVFTCGTDASGGGGSELNWTYFNGSGIRVSTSTNQVLIGGTATTSLAQLEVQGNQYISGNVGIGTTSPYAKLSVVGEIVGAYFTGTTTATSTFGGNLAINGTGTTTSNGGFNITAGCFAVNGVCVGGGSGTAVGGTGAIQFANGTAFNGDNTKLTFVNDNLGIGTSSPYAKLSIQSSFGDTAPLLDIASTTSSGFATSSLFRILASGAVGISTSSPYAKLAIDNTGVPNGSELITNGTFTGSAAGWTLQSSCSVYGSNQVTVTYDASCQADADSANLSTAINTTAGKVYKLVFTLSGVVGDTVYAYFTNNTTSYEEVFSNGTHSVWFTANYTGSDTITFESYDRNTNGTWTIDNVSVQETTANPNSFAMIGHNGSPLLLLENNLLNVAVGKSAFSSSTSGRSNTAIGAFSLSSNTLGNNNTAIGTRSLFSNTSGTNNTAVGRGALSVNTIGSYNTALGEAALFSNTTGEWNTAVGRNALAFNTTGSDNTATGMYALLSNITGLGNTANGLNALYSNTAGRYNAGFGNSALYTNTDGWGNTANGVSALYWTRGSYNIGLGYNAGYSLGSAATSSGNIFLGYAAGNTQTRGDNNIAIGYNVSLASTTGSNQLTIGNLIYGTGINGTGSTLSSGNIGIGTTSPYAKLSVVGEIVGAFFTGTTTATSTFGGNLAINGTGTTTSNGGFNITDGCFAIDGVCIGGGVREVDNYNLGVGTGALYSLPLWEGGNEGENNIAIGGNALYSNTTGSGNIAIGGGTEGQGSLTSNTTGWSNVAVGDGTLVDNLTSSNNTAIGYWALHQNTGTSSTALGSWAGMTNISGNNNLYLGDEADALAGTYSNSAAIGSHAKVGASNSIVLGGTGAWAVNVGIGTTSPFARLSVAGNIFATGTISSLDAFFTNSTTTNATTTNLSTLNFAVTGTGTSTFAGPVAIGTSTQSSMAKLSIGGTMSANGASTAIAGIHEIYTFNPTEGGVQVGGRMVIENQPTSATSTAIGQIIRMVDSSALSNLVRGMDITASGGGNTYGVNTGLRAVGHTFGVQGLTTGLAGGSSTPAALYGESTGTTIGDILRLYTSTMTTATSVAQFYQTGSAFSGAGLLMDFGNGGGSFSGNFADFRVSGNSRFTVSAGGTTTIGQLNQTTVQAGLQVVNGGICVDNDGNCTASTSGRISAREYTTGATDLAENYFSSTTLRAGDIVMLDGSTAVTLATSAPRVLGIVSTEPGIILGLGNDGLLPDQYPVALSGRVPVSVSLENGPIAKGDRITLSLRTPGVGARSVATSSVTVGIALEDWAGPDVPDTMATGTVLAFVALEHRDLGEHVVGERLSLFSTSTGEIVDLFGLADDGADVRYLANKPFNMNAQSIVNVRSIIASNGTWSLDENGKLVVEELEVRGKLKVGTPDNRTGVTLFDETDGSPYCIKMVAGVLQSIMGECGASLVPASAPASGSSSGSGALSAPASDPTSATEGETTGAPAEGSEGASTPEPESPSDGATTSEPPSTGDTTTPMPEESQPAPAPSDSAPAPESAPTEPTPGEPVATEPAPAPSEPA